MDYHIDIRLVLDPEFPATILMGAMFGKLHRALVELQTTDIGVSFPEHQQRSKKNLGALLRLHGTTSGLQRLMTTHWLRGMRDHVTLSNIIEVPADAQHRLVRRRQFKTSAERLRRRRARRHGETIEQAREQIPDSIERKVPLPFVMIPSQSTAQRFPIFIEHGKIRAEPLIGTFNSYGLSQGATVPWFGPFLSASVTET